MSSLSRSTVASSDEKKMAEPNQTTIAPATEEPSSSDKDANGSTYGDMPRSVASTPDNKTAIPNANVDSSSVPAQEGMDKEAHNQDQAGGEPQSMNPETRILSGSASEPEPEPEPSDASTTEINAASLLAIFPTQKEWETAYKTALKWSRIHRKTLLSRVAYLSVLRHTTVPQLVMRSKLIKSRHWNIEKEVQANHRGWMLFWLRMPDDMVAEVVTHANWLKLLEDEYIKIEPAWREFWSLVERYPPSTRAVASTRLDVVASRVYGELAKHDTKRVFLQQRILEGRDFLAAFFREPPAWMEWTTVDTDDEDGDSEVETGFVEELEEGQESEEFEL